MSIKHLRLLLPVLALGLCLYQMLPAQSAGSAMNFSAGLTGWNEVPSVSTKGSGEFHASVRPDGKGIDYEVSYKDLSGAPTMSHIHLGQKTSAGAVMIWLCKTTQASDAPTCPGGTSGSWSGTIAAAQVVGPAAQGVAAGEWEEALEAIRRGHAYVNIHSAMSPSGEIRGQLKPGKGVNGDDDSDDDGGNGKSDKSKGKGKGNGGDGE